MQSGWIRVAKQHKFNGHITTSLHLQYVMMYKRAVWKQNYVNFFFLNW